ncbi:hypothetical protein [Phyllobacterium sophorae]|nr:hypothetical protein [Phyllobacterium sophorae]
MMPDDPLHTRDMVIIAAMIVVGVFVFSAVASAVGKTKHNFAAPPAVARD